MTEKWMAMGFWSRSGTIVAGAAAAVCAVAALPVLGTIGAVTALGCAVVGTAGAAAAAAMGGSSANKPGTKAQATAKETAEAEHIRERAERVKAYIGEAKRLERFQIALYAVSICAAAYDGSVTDDVRRDIREVVQGLSAKMSSTILTEAIEKLSATPPSVNSAMAYAIEFRDAWEEFDDAVEAGLATGSRPAKALTAFRTAWRLAAVEAGLRSRFAPSPSSARTA